MLVFSTSFLVLVYYPFGFASLNDIQIKHIFKKESYAGLKCRRIVGSILLGMTLALLVAGVMFKLQSFPGSHFMLLSGLIYAAIAIIIMLVMFYKKKDDFLKKNLIRTTIIMSIALILYFTSSLRLKKIFYHDNPEYIKAYENYYNHPNDYNSYLKFRLLQEKINCGEDCFEKMKPTIEKEIKEDFESRNHK